MAAIFWHDGKWYEDEQPKLLGPMDHAMWMASVAFDGARGFDGCAPDLDRHCARLINSARKMLLEPTMTAERGRGVVPRRAAPAAARSADLRPADVLRDARLRHAGAGVHDLRARGLRLADARAQRHGMLLLELPAPGAGRGADRRQGELSLSEHAARAGRGRAARLRQRDHVRCRGATSPSWRRRTCGSPGTASP